jgi:paraquat-inducible protein A
LKTKSQNNRGLVREPLAATIPAQAYNRRPEIHDARTSDIDPPPTPGRVVTDGHCLARSKNPADRLIGPGLVIGLALILAGWLLPFMSVTSFFVFSGEISILDAMTQLVEAEEYALSAIVVLFTVVFPIAKFGLALHLWAAAPPGDLASARRAAWLDDIGRWSMLDVFLAALLVVSIKATGMAGVAVHAGVYFFAAGVVLSMLLVRRLARRLCAV